jgi:indole-3-glycerol phosphate synthase
VPLPSENPLNRRDFLGVSATAVAAAQQPGRSDAPAAARPALTVKDVYTKAREAMSPLCRVCPQCDGVACAGELPGYGGVGSGMSFQNNFLALQRVKFKMRPLIDVAPGGRPDTSTTILGRKLSLPALAAPIAGPLVRGLTGDQYFDAIIGGCVAAGTAGAIGDGGNDSPEAVKQRCDVIARYQGMALAGIKPRSPASFASILPIIEASGAFLMTIDVDSGGLYGTGRLREAIRATRLPVLVKGVMTVDQALKAGEAGAAGIVVSNHGGRRLDHTPGTAEALPAIADKVKGHMVILVDGCVHYGTDVLKYLALGADAVLMGRHLVRAAHGGGREGVALFVRTMRSELESAMAMTGVTSIAKISRDILA